MKEITAALIREARTNITVRNEIVTQLIPYVKYIAKNYERRYRCDLESEGALGVIAAINEFDASKKVKFTTFAYYKIQDLMGRYLYKENRSLTIDTTGYPEADLILPNSQENDAIKAVENTIDVAHALVGLTVKERQSIQAYYIDGVSLDDVKTITGEDHSLEYIRQSNLKTIKKIRKQIMPANTDITLQYNPIYTQIIGNLTPDVINALWEELSYNPQNYEYTDKFQSGVWDGVRRLFSKQTYRFRSGLLKQVISILEQHNVTYTVDAGNLQPPFTKRPVDVHYIPMLRDYQKEAVYAAIQSKRGGLSLPPRTGKTIIAAGIISTLPNKTVAFLCFKIEIAIQTKEKFEKILGEPIGFIGNGVIDIQRVNVITVQSALAAYNKKWDFTVFKEQEKKVADKESVKDLLANTGLIICDEYHHYVCKSAEFILGKAKKAEYLFGLSATPWRSYGPESILLENSIGPIIYAKGYDEMIERGYLLPAHIYIYKMPEIKESQRLKSYPTIYKEFVTDNNLRNEFIARIARKLSGEGRSCVITVTQKAHARALESLIDNSVILWGDHDSETRQDVLGKLERKEILVCISTLLDEGVDLQSLDAVIIAAGGKSSINAYQRMRCLTPHSNKKFGLVFDFWDSAKYLKDHSTERFTWYEQVKHFQKVYRTVAENGAIQN